jgi:galactose mutarotase-like enzyme
MKPAKWTGFLYRDNEVSAPSQGWANNATVMGDRFFCIEPCRGLTDNHEQRAFEAFEDKKGIETISSGGELRLL